jgi:hypothetical protein
VEGGQGGGEVQMGMILCPCGTARVHDIKIRLLAIRLSTVNKTGTVRGGESAGAAL